MKIAIDEYTLQDVVHGCWFSRENMQFDSETQSFRLPLGDTEDRLVRLVLSVDGAIGVEVQDDAEVGVYDLERVRILDDAIEIRSNLPFTIRVRTSPGAVLKVERA